MRWPSGNISKSDSMKLENAHGLKNASLTRQRKLSVARARVMAGSRRSFSDDGATQRAMTQTQFINTDYGFNTFGNNRLSN